MNITLFGGSFNPPHIGHQIVSNQALELIPEVDEIWLVPDYKSTYEDKVLEEAEHRLKMTKMLENHVIKLQTCNIDNETSGNTIETVEILKKQYPQHKFSFLMGSDQLSGFRSWGRWQKLLSEMEFFIYPRSTYPMRPLQKHMSPLLHPLQVISNISSTMVRQRLQNDLTVKHLIPPKIATYIERHNLYRS
jgi:nicotinate-nucleotide adenylyltransferase